MPRFSLEEENKIYSVARNALQKTDSNVTESSPASIVWRRGNTLVVVVWVTKDIPRPSYDPDPMHTYYTQYNYHVAMRVIYSEGQRFLRVLDTHDGGRNVWDGPFHCGICKYVCKQ